MVHHRSASDRHHGVMIFTMAQELLSFFLTSISEMKQMTLNDEWEYGQGK